MSPNTSANSSLSLEIFSFLPLKKELLHCKRAATEQQDVCQESVNKLKGFRPFAVVAQHGEKEKRRDLSANKNNKHGFRLYQHLPVGACTVSKTSPRFGIDSPLMFLRTKTC